MVVEILSRSVHCDRCTNTTEAFSQFDCTDYRPPTAKQIRDWFDFHRVKSNGAYIDLCPTCYAKYKENRL